jgi:hypothetical protein
MLEEVIYWATCSGQRTALRVPEKMPASPFTEFAMENAVYWKGRQVGIECAGRILWFSSAPQEAIAAYSVPQTKPVGIEKDSVVARNLVMTPAYDRLGRRD